MKVSDWKKKVKDREQNNKKNGEWLYHGESDEWYWTGENEPEFTGDGFVCEAPTEEDLKLLDEARERWMQADMKAREKRKKTEERKRKKRSPGCSE